MPPEFLISYTGPKTCELFANGAGITLYIPKRENFEAVLELECSSYVAAETEARKMGFETKWNL